ncbi:MAG: ATP phosphoribosyltransferase regulatory subunit [Gemmatimonadota bacterium]|nr:ATP phosphoribosyltransferase regulatory subunit [Gemmatimonadota bacterium]MDQ8148681.1 ATP phosphoribosyltransferase regulatory subunit [Gemmatimonadota bacterium]
MSSAALPGFRDFYPDELARRAHIFQAWRAVARRYAFVEYDGPPLEPLDLYTKKSGDEIVGQLYNFTDKGGREVALRPEMTPTFARMVGARANALRKPVRWFSIPQLFRYERAQRGRLREHYQLNVDIVGESSEVADAELLGVAIDIMRALGLTEADVRARVSDRRLLGGILTTLGVTDLQIPAVYAVVDKIARQPREVSAEKLAAAGLTPTQVERVLGLAAGTTFEAVRAEFGAAPAAAEHVERFGRYLGHLEALGVGGWVDLDLSIVRGLAYYTGIVFELFDAKGELRAICGGGRYDTLLKSLGGVDLPALGFGMGDVVLGELLADRGLVPAPGADGADLYLVAGNGAVGRPYAEALQLVSALRGAGFSVNHGLNAERFLSQATRNQVDGAKKSGAAAVIGVREDGRLEVTSILGRMKDAPTYEMDPAATLAGDVTTMQGLRDWLAEQRATARETNG